ncbi:30S ribosomal protein S9 [Candidatus Pacearchaeota archaeon]|nr:30S ribosomal protein S9 [Candidatus Pacearchaeota archaeon]
MRVVTSGKRKTAIAVAVLTEGSGKVTVNKKPYDKLHLFDSLKLQEPLRIAGQVLGKINFDIAVNVRRGGEKSQIEAARLAIARALVEATKSRELHDAFMTYDRSLLVADVRRKEAYKPGDSKARAKRQTSYR